jgi:predicted RNA-binding protein with EMAP domain
LTIIWPVRIHKTISNGKFVAKQLRHEKGELNDGNQESSSEEETRQEEEITGFRFPGF